MLYSVVICDLIYKLEELRDVYNDSTAKKILIEIEGLQKANPKSSDWENKLVEMIADRTKLLEISDVENINQLQKHRHLSAHPVLNQTSLLFKPNKENVKSHIINMLSGVLTKPPILSTKIFSELVNDLATNRDRFSEDKDLKRFLSAKYFKNLRQETLDDIFKKIWKLVFKLENEECDLNREINYRTINIIFALNPPEILKLLKTEEAHFDGILPKVCTNYFFNFLFDNPKAYNVLSELNKAHVDHEIENSLEFKFLSWFKFDSIMEYHEFILSEINDGGTFYLPMEIIHKLKELYKDFNMKEKFLDLYIAIFAKSNLFDTADRNFNQLIQPYLEDFSEGQLQNIVYAINNNGQLHNRGLARYSNRLVKAELDRKITDFKYSDLYNFRT
ncbi:hypothetical protein GCM10007424_00530 [Flavobacterium suaedae]|uniref:Uncharacterized protein n=2 Tax=Flavobacterium suaedae TaxID=1767027 RepID=A0ABQ1JBN5_9FLAO|nr:hypothetical protein GCM10007424_00530 [Flavobacterium suaedae]